MLLLTREPETLLANWQRPPAEGYAPQISTADDVKRGDVITAFLVISGCHADSDGLCDVSAELEVTYPDGSPYGDPLGGPLWKGPPGPKKTLLIGSFHVGIDVEPDDPVGIYRVDARVCDQGERETCVDLRQDFDVLRRMDSFDLRELTKSYYLDPRPEYVELAIRELAAIDQFLENQDTWPPMVGFLAEIFAAEPDRVPAWSALIEGLDEPARVIFRKALERSKGPRHDQDAEPSPSLNDIWWGSFFASGNTAFLDRLVDQLALVDGRPDLASFMVGSSAKWSLASNARQHRAVRSYLEARLAEEAGSQAGRREHLHEVLEKTPEEIRDEMVALLRERKAAGDL